MKRELILIRHTKSSWADKDMHDFDRPLKKDRTDDAKEMARHLKEFGLKPDLILCSPALRAKQTAELFCNQLKYDFDKIVFDMRLYESSAKEYMRVVHETDKQIKSLMLIGHNPSITDFINEFMETKLDELPTTGVIWLEFETDDWNVYRTTYCRLKKLMWPSILKGMRKR